MGTVHDRWRDGVTRREALVALAGVLASPPLAGSQQDPRPLKDHTRVPGLDENHGLRLQTGRGTSARWGRPPPGRWFAIA